MWPFNLFKIFIIGLFVLIASACSTLQPGKDDAEKIDPAQESPIEGEAQPGTTVEKTGIAALPQVADPMKVNLPLDLIKGYDQVVSLLASKNNEQAITKLTQLQVAFPKNSGPSYRLARIYLEQKEYDKSLTAIEKSLVVNGKNYYAQNLKGVILREKGEFDKAKQAYLSAVNTYPRHAESHLNLGILADIYMYDLPLALKHYQYYLELIGTEDRKVNGWVIDLKRRMPAAE